MERFLAVLARNVADTATYLLAYRGAPVAAIVAAVLLARCTPTSRFLSWARRPATAWSLAGGMALGITRPLGRGSIGRPVAALGERPEALVACVATRHGLNAYYLLLMGPLLGKDALLSHVIGLLLFIGVATAICRWSGWHGATRGDVGNRQLSGEGASSLWSIARAEVPRALALMCLGLVLGGAVAACGLTFGPPALVELVGAGGNAQLANALLAMALSAATCMVPVANLFVGTYLWKVGLAHAGLVAFLLAATFSPQRIRQYRRRLGTARARRLTVALVLAALLASMATAALYRATTLSINYKLIPEQMW